MINREITYERDVSISYMKIAAVPDAGFDEEIMLKKQIEGLLPVEKCYLSGGGQYWYNISGLQALDVYCKMNPIGRDFFEKVLLRLCEIVEVMDWNLMDTNCLVVDPELIFLNHMGEEVTFLVYPNNSGNLFVELQELLEYLLSRLNHSDKMAVKEAYDIYEMTLTDGCSVSKIKERILKSRMEQVEIPIPKIQTQPLEVEASVEEDTPKSMILQIPYVERVIELCEKGKQIWQDILKKIKKEKEIDVVYPTEIEKEEPSIIKPRNKTICIGEKSIEPEGIFISESGPRYPDFEVRKSACVIGSGKSANMNIERDTISQLHAKISYTNDTYYIEDMNSTNGTYLNDKALNYRQNYELKTGDVVRFADVTYRFI